MRRQKRFNGSGLLIVGCGRYLPAGLRSGPFAGAFGSAFPVVVF
jgi:hypothetical protein